jgi:phospholipase/lecithinase/hemolysin
MKSQRDVANLVSAITNWNGQLPDRIVKFKSANTDANVTMVDTQEPFNTAINSPKDYGAPNADCTNSNGKSCLWFNSYHPGTAIQKLVGQAVAMAFKGSFF